MMEIMKPRPRGADCARVTTVIETKSLRGSGTEEIHAGQ